MGEAWRALTESARGGWQAPGYDLDDLKAIDLAEYEATLAFHRAVTGKAR